MIKIENITQETFKLYGNIIAFPEKNQGDFYIVDTDESEPWRLAVFRYSNKTIQTLEFHPTSKESFEPLSGITLLLVAEQQTPENYQVFLLDKPICLKKNTWHQVLSLTSEAQVKITENLNVESVFHELTREIGVWVG